MKIVIPVSKSDVEHLDLLTQVIIHQGSLIGHDILLFPTPCVQEQAMQAAVKLRSVCPTVEVKVADADYPEGWPQAPNRHWHCAVNYLDNSGNKSPWLWLEADAVPMVPHWASLLWDAYLVGGQPFYGFVKPVRYTRPGVEGFFTKANDDIMMGVGIYPPGISRDLLIQPLFNNLGRTFQAAKEPFDLYLRWVFKRRGVCASTIIQDLWRTVNYRRDGETIVCDPLADEPRANAGVVPGTAVLVHGVKDGSLQRLLLGGVEKPKAEPVRPIKLVPVAEKPLVVSDTPVTDTAMRLYLSKDKPTFKGFQEAFGLDIRNAATKVRDLGFRVGSFGRISKLEPEGEL